MDEIITDPIVTMTFPISGGENANRNDVVSALLNSRDVVEGTFKNDEYLKLDLTHQEIIGIKSTSKMLIPGAGKKLHVIGDLPALNFVVANNEKYKGSKIINLGNVNALYEYYNTH